MKIGILKETKSPPDKRVALTPGQCRELEDQYPGIQIIVQPSSIRAFTDQEYEAQKIEINEDISECSILFGVKEVKPESLQEKKTYLFFSHTAKKQIHNRGLLQETLRKKIQLIDYEYLTTDSNLRVAAFGHWAGIVGAYNGLMAYGLNNQRFTLAPAWKCKDSIELFDNLRSIRLGKQKILITGGGRVAHGAIETLRTAGIRQISVHEFIHQKYSDPVFAQIDPGHYVKHKNNKPFDLGHFFTNPQDYESTFRQYTKVTNTLIACHYWDPMSPVFFTREDMLHDDFKIKIIADVSCDIPGPIPSTLRASSIESPFYGYDPKTGEESYPWAPDCITVMAVDNLPGELPRDASSDFGRKLFNEVIPFLLGAKKGGIIERATIAVEGKLTKRFEYLQDFVNGLVT